jgi:nucleoside-diphosphate-sugar epimerase
MTTKRKNLTLGKGLVGAHLAELLRENGEEVAVLSRGDGHDLTRAEQYLDQFAWADRVWFVAWNTGVRKKESSPADEIEVLDSDLRLCQSVFGCLEKTKKPFLFVSSQAAPAKDMVAQGVAKRVGEMWTRLLGGQVARLWNIYGWTPVDDRSHLIPDLIVSGLKEKKIRLMTSGDETRQFLYVRDCAEAFLHQFKTGQKHADVTTDVWTPVKDIARLIGEKLGAEVEFGPKPGKASLYIPETPLEGWKPRFSLSTGLDETIKEAKMVLSGK